MFQCIVQPRSEFGQRFQDMKGAFTEIRSQFEDHLECLDIRLEQQKGEISDIQDYFKKRADIERKYSKDLEGLSKSMYNKHREILKNEAAPSSTAILRELVKETKKTARNHAVVEEIFGTEMHGRCHKISSDIGRVYKQCREAGVEIQEKVLGVLFELHTKTKIYQTNKETYELAERKLRDAEKEISKLEKEIKPEKREKTKKYTNAQKQLKNRHIRHEDTYGLAIKSQLEYVLCTEAANAAIKKYYKDDLSDLMDCMDLGFHHLLTNVLKMRTSALENLIASKQEDMDVMAMALGSLDSRKDKTKFLENHSYVFSLPPMFELRTSKPLQSGPEDMDVLKGKIQERIVKLRDLSDYTAKVIEDAEAELLQIFNEKSYDMTSLFVNETNDLKSEETSEYNSRLGLEELIIENNKRLLTTNNRIEQEEAKYENLKKSLVVQQFCPETLPRPNVKKRKSKIQTIGLPKIFGGSLDDYYEATGDKIPLVIESCIRTINLFGMRHQGIFRVTGSHIDIKQFKEAFENGEDPFACMMDGNQINTVSGVLKSYFRKLTEPLFSEAYFDQFMNITNIGENVEFVVKARNIVQQWSEPHIAVTRYLFAFLNDLSQYSEETQMDPYNIAICFGPNLCPIPEGKDLVQHTNLVNDLIKNFIIFCKDIFTFEIDGPAYVNADVGNINDEKVTEKDEEKVEETSFPQPEEAVALYEYKAGTDKELSFNKGDKLFLFSKASEHWWKGSREGVKGLIPAQYVQMNTGLVGIYEDSPKEKNSDENLRKEDVSSSFLLDEDHKQIVSKTLSFKSNRSMWENIDKEKDLTEKSRTLDRPKKKSANPVAAPDLLQDLLEKSLADPGGRSRSGSNISAGRLSPGQDVPDGLCKTKKEEIKDTEV
eukprot:TRINITY_DN16073_c0_g1_i10.p1 TRINITY_DN16073_c0_g1~~TRINITY_DN16073_c0_g1_i10.p1  ORF type:complete len:884 (-),score=266.77 TRINITY_DN16073_c0_g1_i10:79-2730(-)